MKEKVQHFTTDLSYKDIRRVDRLTIVQNYKIVICDTSATKDFVQPRLQARAVRRVWKRGASRTKYKAQGYEIKVVLVRQSSGTKYFVAHGGYGVLHVAKNMPKLKSILAFFVTAVHKRNRVS